MSQVFVKVIPAASLPFVSNGGTGEIAYLLVNSLQAGTVLVIVGEFWNAEDAVVPWEEFTTGTELALLIVFVIFPWFLDHWSRSIHDFQIFKYKR